MKIDEQRQLTWLKFKEDTEDCWDEGVTEEMAYNLFMDGYEAGRKDAANASQVKESENA